MLNDTNMGKHCYYVLLIAKHSVPVRSMTSIKSRMSVAVLHEVISIDNLILSFLSFLDSYNFANNFPITSTIMVTGKSVTKQHPQF